MTKFDFTNFYLFCTHGLKGEIEEKQALLSPCLFGKGKKRFCFFLFNYI